MSRGDFSYCCISLCRYKTGNRTFLQGCAVSLAGDDSGLLIDTKALEAEPITVAASQATTLGLVFVFVLPAAVLVAGAVVVLLRRRR